MVFDDIIIGSGLSALAVAMGLPTGRSILVFGGPEVGILLNYPQTNSVPCQYLGYGGLGNYWHGVIPCIREDISNNERWQDFRSLFAEFYPVAARYLTNTAPALFIPRSPIRPKAHWERLLKSRKLTMIPAVVSRVELAGAGAAVEAGGQRYEARRVWCCAGALETPRLLTRSFGAALSTGHVSDHVIISLGLARSDARIIPQLRRGLEGYFMKPVDSPDRDLLLTARPARFGFASLDGGIERRAVFGLPTKSILRRLMKAPDPGLVSEALFNKLGLFPNAMRYNLYAQLWVRDAYTLKVSAAEITVRPEIIRQATDRVRDIVRKLLPQLEPSLRPELYIPGIHLHRTIDLEAAQASGIGSTTSPVQLADASILDNIGGAHHSFGMMVSAWKVARTTG